MGIFIGGNFHSWKFSRGKYSGGNFSGGNFLGGNFHGALYFKFFLIGELKKMSNISFLHDFQIMVF